MSTPRTTFFSKNEITCPVCSAIFKKEELQTGRGRLNAGNLTEELHRLYIPTQKYGLINPLIYPILVCPECYFAGFQTDFAPSTDPNFVSNASIDTENRKKIIASVFGGQLNFQDYRNQFTGLASYLLAFASTIHFNKYSSPTARRALYSLRAAWIAKDLFEKSNINHFKELSDEMYYQAYINYDKAIDLQIKGKESFDGFKWMGPDIDTNFGYDGLLYITAYLSIKHIDDFPPSEQIIKIGQAKRVLSKIFGVGKSNREKPGVLVSHAKNLYIKANNILKILEDDGMDISIAEQIENEADTNEE
ncbi:MAG: DUF2225 domain-containing protein [Brevinema sp.]